MRNFIIAGAVLGTAAGLVLYERGALAHTRQESAALTEKDLELSESIASERTAIGDLNERLKTQKANLSLAEQGARKERMAQEPVPAREPDPAQEGRWPSARPYFYLAKQHIPSIEYPTFGATGGISNEAAALFGMSAAERSEVEAAMRRMFAQLKEAELQNVTLTNTPSDASNRPGKKISIRVPPNPELAEVQKGVIVEIAGILGGGQRAELFLQRAADESRQFESFSRVERVVTLIPKDDMTGEIITSTDSGSSYNYYDLSREQDWIGFQYGHLLDKFLPESEGLQE